MTPNQIDRLGIMRKIAITLERELNELNLEAGIAWPHRSWINDARNGALEVLDRIELVLERVPHAVKDHS